MSVRLGKRQRGKSAKEEIFAAALSIFNVKGFAGTSVRDIAKKAEVNVSTISYYFEGKQGLLKHAFIEFFEPYIKILEDGLLYFNPDEADKGFKQTIEKIMDYQYNNFELSRFVWREVSIDSQIVRELMSTYFMKERYILTTMLEAGVKSKRFKKIPPGIAIIQLKAIISMPFLYSIYTSEVWNIYYQERFYFKKYKEQMMEWIDAVFVNRTGVAVNKEMI